MQVQYWLFARWVLVRALANANEGVVMESPHEVEAENQESERAEWRL